MDFAVPTDHRVKLEESEKKDLSLDLIRGLKKTMELESDGYTNCNWNARYSHQRIDKETGGLGNKRTSGDNPNDIFINIGKNTEKSAGDTKRLAVIQTPVRNDQLMLV